MIAFEGFSQMLLNFLRIPPGSSYRGANGDTNSSDSAYNEIVKSNELIQSIVDITIDDVCIGNEPLYLDSKSDIPEDVKAVVVDSILSEFNKIVKWAGRDLLAQGISIFEPKSIGKKKKFTLIPVLDEVEVYLNSSMNLVVYKKGENTNLKNAIVFINYDKSNLTPVDSKEDYNKGEKFLFTVMPCPIQLKNIKNTAAELVSTEKSILRYRQQLSRIVRFATVEVGVSQGQNQQDVIDNISSAINADSMTLDNMTTFNLYNDTIPVIPVRKSVGKPEYSENVNTPDIKELADLDRIQQKIFLQTKFPKTYADFSTALGETAASTIRGDVRYSRLIKAVRTNIEKTINAYLALTPKLKKYAVVFKLTELPTPEDADVVDSLSAYGDFVNEVYEFVVNTSANVSDSLNKLELIKLLMGGSANLKSIQKFFDSFVQVIKTHFKNSGDDMSSDDYEDSEGFGSTGSSEGSESAPDFDNEGFENQNEPESGEDYTNAVETFPTNNV